MKFWLFCQLFAIGVLDALNLVYCKSRSVILFNFNEASVEFYDALFNQSKSYQINYRENNHNTTW